MGKKDIANKNGEKKSKNIAIESLKQNREKGYIRNRVFATVIDFIIIGFIYELIVVLFGAPDIRAYTEMQDLVQGLARNAPEVIERQRLWNDFFYSWVAVSSSYEALMLMLFGASIGKLIFRFRVVPKKEGHSFIINKLLLILRAAIKGISLVVILVIPYLVLCLTTLGNPESRSGFDLFAGTKVIKKGG